MKPNRFFILSVCTAALLNLISCKNTEESRPVPLTVFETYSKAVMYELVDSQHFLGPQTDITVCDSLTLILPVKINGQDAAVLTDSIQQHALDSRGTPFDEAVANWISPVVSETELPYKAVDLPVSMADGFQIVQGYVVNLSPNFLTYCIRTSTYYPGAANGMETADYINYDIAANKILTLSDLFTPEGLNALPAQIAAQAQNNMTYRDEVEITALPENGNFYLSSEGEIVFSYQPMDVAPHALGIIQVSFYPYELAQYMTPFAIRLFGLQDLTF